MSRHTLPGLALLGAGAATIASAFCWPRGADSDDVATMLGAAAAHPTGWTLANAFEVLAAVLGVAGSLGVLSRLRGQDRGRGRGLALLASVCAVLGCVAAASSGAGNTFVLALAQRLPESQAGTVYQAFTTQPYLFGIFPLFYVGMLGWLLLVIAAVRGHLVPWWLIAVEVLGLVLVGAVDDGLDAPYNALVFVPQLFVLIILAIRLMTAAQPVAPVRDDTAVEAAPGTGEPVLA